MYGLMLGRRGCEAANRGLVGVHSEECRARIDKAMAVKEPERLERMNQARTRLGSQDEGTQDESAGLAGDESNVAIKGARTRLKKSQQQQQQQQQQ